ERGEGEGRRSREAAAVKREKNVVIASRGMAARRFSFHIECSACGEKHDAGQLNNLCRKCSGPLLVLYDISPAPELRAEIRDRAPNMWRYAEVLPDGEPVTLGEGITPLLPSKLSAGVWIKDESKN